MNDINRPLRRLEVARRIQELRDKAAAEQAGGLEPSPADAVPADAVPAPDASPTPDAAPGQDAGPAAEEDDASAAATIASLLRGGQTWLLDRGQ